uniref:Uncharacterized protein n=1 Tax=Salix viminalis TaxID=40686 RepID=A0A6N2LP18_SALVM
MKAFLIVCFLLATVVFSPLSTCTARELAERANVQGNVVVDLAGGNGPLNPHKPPFNCGRGKRYCVTPAPKKRCRSLYRRNC